MTVLGVADTVVNKKNKIFFPSGYDYDGYQLPQGTGQKEQMARLHSMPNGKNCIFCSC